MCLREGRMGDVGELKHAVVKEAGPLMLISALLLTSCVTLGKSLNLAKPPFSHHSIKEVRLGNTQSLFQLWNFTVCGEAWHPLLPCQSEPLHTCLACASVVFMPQLWGPWCLKSVCFHRLRKQSGLLWVWQFRPLYWALASNSNRPARGAREFHRTSDGLLLLAHSNYIWFSSPCSMHRWLERSDRLLSAVIAPCSNFGEKCGNSFHWVPCHSFKPGHKSPHSGQQHLK